MTTSAALQADIDAETPEARIQAAIDAGLFQVSPYEPVEPTRSLRFSYFTSPSGRWYFWTTERNDAGKFASGIYRPAGRGARSGKAREIKLVERSVVTHRRRKDAKARALRLWGKEEPSS